MQESYVLLYGGKKGEYEKTAFLRARAARLRDEYGEASEGKELTDQEWQDVEELLSQAYSHFPLQRIFVKT